MMQVLAVCSDAQLHPVLAPSRAAILHPNTAGATPLQSLLLVAFLSLVGQASMQGTSARPTQCLHPFRVGLSKGHRCG